MYLPTNLPLALHPHPPYTRHRIAPTHILFFLPPHTTPQERARKGKGKEKNVSNIPVAIHTKKSPESRGTCTYLWVHVLTSLACHVVLAGIGAAACWCWSGPAYVGYLQLDMYCMYIVCTFVHLYICIDYSGGSGCCVRACEVRRYSGTWNVVYEVFFFFLFFLFLFFGGCFGFGRGKGKGKKREEEDFDYRRTLVVACLILQKEKKNRIPFSLQ